MNERGNVIGLMPHPEHAVDPLLGSADGALILSSLVDSARERALTRPSRPRLPSSASAQRRMLGQRGPQPLEVAQPQRHRPAPRRAVGRVREADEPLALLRLEQLDDRREPLVACALLQRQLLDRVRRTPRRRDRPRS